MGTIVSLRSRAPMGARIRFAIIISSSVETSIRARRIPHHPGARIFSRAPRIKTLVRCRKEGEDVVRVFFLMAAVITLLVLALGGLEAIAARRVSVATPLPN